MTNPSEVVSEILAHAPGLKSAFEQKFSNLQFAGKVEIATHRIAYLFMLAKCVHPENEREYRARVDELKGDINFCPEMADFLRAAIDLDNTTIEDIDECVPPEVRERRLREMGSLIF